VDMRERDVSIEKKEIYNARLEGETRKKGLDEKGGQSLAFSRLGRKEKGGVWAPGEKGHLP